MIYNTSMLTTTQVAELHHVKRITVLFWIRRGHLPAVKHGRDWMIAEADAAAFVPRKVGRPKQR